MVNTMCEKKKPEWAWLHDEVMQISAQTEFMSEALYSKSTECGLKEAGFLHGASRVVEAISKQAMVLAEEMEHYRSLFPTDKAAG